MESVELLTVSSQQVEEERDLDAERREGMEESPMISATMHGHLGSRQPNSRYVSLCKGVDWGLKPLPHADFYGILFN